MPAVYAHYYFGKQVLAVLNEDLKHICTNHFASFAIGLQGPDTLLYHMPYTKNIINITGDKIHKEAFSSFLKKAIPYLRIKGLDSKEYAYILGYICHFTFDSEVHPYVDSYAETNKVSHVFMETEFDKYILLQEGKDPLKEDLSKCIPHDFETAKSIHGFYEDISARKAYQMLKEMYLERKLLYTPNAFKYNALCSLFQCSDAFKGFEEMMMKKDNHPKCEESNLYLYNKMLSSIELASMLLQAFDDTLQNGTKLHTRFYRDFETEKNYYK